MLSEVQAYMGGLMKHSVCLILKQKKLFKKINKMKTLNTYLRHTSQQPYQHSCPELGAYLCDSKTEIIIRD